METGCGRLGCPIPYPATENWRKAIGGFSIWATGNISASVDEAKGMRTIDMEIHIDMEDMYNFNPGQNHISTGVLNAVFGRLQIVGFGHEFKQEDAADRQISITRAIRALGECDPDRPDTIGGGDGQRAARTARAYPHLSLIHI